MRRSRCLARRRWCWGRGPIRIGQGIEFDYCSVRAAQALRAAGVASIMVNSNPETVSTDFDMSDRLYFESLDDESVLAILENEAGTLGTRLADVGVNLIPRTIVAVPGAVSFPPSLSSRVEILLSPPHSCASSGGRRRLGSRHRSRRVACRSWERRGEHRSCRGSPPLRRVDGAAGRAAAAGAAVRTADEALGWPTRLAIPCWCARRTCWAGGRWRSCVRARSLERYVTHVVAQFGEHPILIDRYLSGREVEVDALCDGRDVLIPGIMEHIERAGVHSGDSFAVYPTRSLSADEIAAVARYTREIALALGVRGLMNAQFVLTAPEGAPGSNVYILEVNPRASRTVPFL